MLEWLVSSQRPETEALLEAFAGYLSRWSDVTTLAVHEREVCGMAVVFLRGLATGKLFKDRQTQIVLRQLGKCLSLWGLTRDASSGPSGLEIEFKHGLSVGHIETQEQTLDPMNQTGSKFGLMVERMLSESKGWLASSVSDPNQLSTALIALKGLAEHHQDQRIMELAWATANMLDRLSDGTLSVNQEFRGVVERSVRLLLLAYVFQVWTTEDEAEYAKTLEDADILASGGELKFLR